MHGRTPRGLRIDVAAGIATLLLSLSLVGPTRAQTADVQEPQTEAGDSADATVAAEPSASAADSADENAAPDTPERLPLLEISGSADLSYERVISADDPDARIRDVFLSFEPEILLNLSQHARLGAVLIYEPVRDPGPGEARTFGDEGLAVKELYAGFDVGRATLQLGKISPTFGWAFDDAPGIYGGDFGSTYELVGDLGANARISLSERPGAVEGTTAEQALHLSLFTEDTTFLSDSLFTSRGRFSKADSSVGVTDVPQSFAVAYTFQVRNADHDVAGPNFQAAVRRLAPNASNDNGEWGLVGSFEDRFALGDDLALLPIAEAAYFVHSDGASSDAWAFTVGAELAKGPWHVSSVYAMHDMMDDGIAPDRAITVDLGRTFDVPQIGEIRADLAYVYAREAESASQTVGLQIEKELDLHFW